jgi:hypothetical protein
LKGKNQRETNTGFRQRNREQVITQLAMKWWQAFLCGATVCTVATDCLLSSFLGRLMLSRGSLFGSCRIRLFLGH